MKVLKKIKARIGLSNKAALHSPPAQPLEFHPVHGDNVLLTQGNTIAARYTIFTIYMSILALSVALLKRKPEDYCLWFVS